jgi:hypothetical protein
MNIELNIGVDIDQLAVALSRLPNDQIINLFKAVDDMVCEYEFTEELAKTFQAVIDKENETK